MDTCIYRVYWRVNGRTREEFCETRVERNALVKMLADLHIQAGYDYSDGQTVGSIAEKSAKHRLGTICG